MRTECEKCIHEKVCNEWGYQEGMFACSYGDFFEPVSDVAPVVHGYWIKDRERYEIVCSQSTIYHCSVCGRKAGHKQVKLYDYCPKCGAKMDLEG